MWEEKDNFLQKKFEFKNFREAFGFMTRVAFIAEEHGHHPDWENSFNTVHVKLTSHDKGDVVTDKDRNMAEAIDKLNI